AAIGGEVLRRTDDDFRNMLDQSLGASRFGLDALLADERGEVVKTLSSDAALGSERAAYLKRWVECVSALRRGALEDDAVLELLIQASAHSLPAEELPWIGALEERLYARLEGVVAAPTDEALISRALRWLDVLWEAGLLAGTWRLHDVQQRWSLALAGSKPSMARDACRALGARLGIAQSVEAS
ncbi:MAG: hypothetical protein HYZ74_07595, partial [Elusimicrobia bacterium]|nr:hypothetical protein [Elusimicrobiota bacterium]